VNAELARLSEARHLAGDLLVEFSRAADASNRAVMAESDAISVTFAHEADQANADRRPVAPQHQRAIPGHFAGPEAEADRALRGNPARTP
jgi:hypothetical protein